ncbi:hypothetical protein RclHR1_09390013 [Rhizophagus clarus]|uniref:TRP C-terminal domain-containing protein n=1 Tax=Rhizophagus clarus TaxID=94130 RepID=A0A2Z6SQ57_9GLOM|nr:hypothetical protein RclHR1_09390013 [Rhizophagus clarus]
MSKLRRVNLCFYAIILLSFYTIQVLSNPINQRPTPTLQRRQVVITSTSTSTTTDATKVITVIEDGPRSIETYSPSKPKKCDGPVKFSKIQLIAMKSSKALNFIVSGKTSINIDNAFVKTSIYWDNKRSVENISSCPTTVCDIQRDQSTIIFNYTTSLPDELLDNNLSGRSAYVSLSVLDEEDNVLGCITTSFNGIVTDLIPYLFNIPLICGVIAAVICIAARSRKKEHDKKEHEKNHDGHDRDEIHKNHENHTKHTHITHPSSQGGLGSENPQSTPYNDPSGNLQPTSQSTAYSDPSGNLQPTSQSTPYSDPSGNSGNNFHTAYDPTSGKSTTPAQTPITQHPPPSNQAPSIYDIIRIAQFFVTTALISLPGIPYGYRDVMSKLGWAIGLPNSIVLNIVLLSNIADERVRGGICHMGNICSNLITSLVAYNSDSTCTDLSQPTPSSIDTGLTSFGKQLGVPDYNFFFIVLISFCFALLILFYYPITLLAFYQLVLIKDCWLFIFLAAICVVFLSLGTMIFCGYKILRPYFLGNWNEYKKPSYVIFYGSLYTQYNENEDKSSNRVWFSIFATTYDFLRAIIIGLGQRSAVLQIIGLLVTETILFFLLVKHKPYKHRWMNRLKISVSVVQFIYTILLISFFGNTPLSYRLIIDNIMKFVQFILTTLIFIITILNLTLIIKNLMNKKSKNDEKDDDDDRRKIIEETKI